MVVLTEVSVPIIPLIGNVPPVATKGKTVSTQTVAGVGAIVIILGVGLTVTVIPVVVAQGLAPVD